MAETMRVVIQEQAVKAAAPLPTLSLEDFIATASTDPPWLVEGLLTQQTVNLAVGLPRSFKSMLASNIAVAVAGGAHSVMGFPIRRHGPVLIIAQEGSRYYVAQRFARMAEVYGTGARRNLHVAYRTRFRLDDPGTLESLRLTIADLAPVLVIIDTLRRSHQGNEDRSEDMQPIMDALETLAEECRTTFLLVHHSKKSPVGSITDKTRGSGAIVGSVQGTMYLDVETQGGLKTGRGTIQVESKDAEDQTVRWTLDPATFVMTRADEEVQPTPDVIASLVRAVTDAGTRATAPTLYRQWQMLYPSKVYGRSAWSDHVKAAWEAGRIVRHGATKGAHYTQPLTVVEELILELSEEPDDAR